MLLLTTITLAAVVEPAEILGSWCTPGWPVCAFDVREQGVGSEADNTVRPWQLDGDVLTFDPDTPEATQWRIHGTGPTWIQAELLETGTVAWFSREPTEAPAMLADFYPHAWADRVHVAAGTVTWRLRASEDWQTGPTPHPMELVVVEVQPDAVRVVGEWGGVRAAVWVAQQTLSQRVIATTALAPGVTVLPGAPIKRRLQQGKTWVVVAEEGLVVTGVLHEDAIGHRYQPRPADRTLDRTSDWSLTGTTITDIDGAVLAEFDAETWGWWVVSAERTDSPRSPVTVRTAHLEVEGFVDTSVLVSSGIGMFSGTGGFSHHTTHLVDVALSAGTLLRRGEEITGMVLRDTTLQASPGQQPPDVAVRVVLPWGSPAMMADCPTLDPDGRGWICQD